MKDVWGDCYDCGVCMKYVDQTGGLLSYSKQYPLVPMTERLTSSDPLLYLHPFPKAQ